MSKFWRKLNLPVKTKEELESLVEGFIKYNELDKMKLVQEKRGWVIYTTGKYYLEGSEYVKRYGNIPNLRDV